MNLCPPSVTVSTYTPAFKAVAFQSPAMPNARMSLWMQSVHSFSFPPRPLRTALSRFPKTIRFGSRPSLIRRSVPAHKSLLVRNVVSMLSHPVISRARLYEVIHGTTQRVKWRLKRCMTSSMTSPFPPTATPMRHCMHYKTRITKWLRRGWESLTPSCMRVLFGRYLMNMAISRQRCRRLIIATGLRSSHVRYAILHPAPEEEAAVVVPATRASVLLERKRRPE